MSKLFRRLVCVFAGHGTLCVHSEWMKVERPTCDGGKRREFRRRETTVCTRCGSTLKEEIL